MKFTTAQDAVKSITSHSRIYIQCAAATPTLLTHALTERAAELQNVEICHLQTFGDAPYADVKYKDSFFVNSFYIGGNVRNTLPQGNGSYTPIFLSELPLLFDRNQLALDAVFIQVSPPDANGFCSLGVSVEATRAAIRTAKMVVAQINKFMPHTYGDALVHIDEIDWVVEHHVPLLESLIEPMGAIEHSIGRHVASLIEDNNCLQIGIGSIPNAVLSNLTHHKDLGVFTEMFSDGVIDLVESGVITCKHNKIHPGKMTSTFLQGSQRLFDFVNENKLLVMKESNFTNDTHLIRQNDRMVSINSAIEIDVTGQVCADSFGPKMYSGVGGQIDYIRGAGQSKGGKAIIAMPSVTKKGVNKIVPTLKPGAGVVSTRANVQYIVTEYGIANLYGKTIKQRVQSLIEIAHPMYREQIERDYYELIQ